MQSESPAPSRPAGGTADLGVGELLRLYKSSQGAALERQNPNVQLIYVAVRCCTAL